MKQTADFLIIGSGIAGLSLALKLAESNPSKKVIVTTKAHEAASNTKYAQGGVAVVIDRVNDSFEKHIEDTLICGAGLCEPDVVKMVVENAPVRLQELIDWGARFDKNKEGNLDLGREGGHSAHRIVHHKDQTGNEIEQAMLSQLQQRSNIILLNYHFAIDLIHKDNRCEGAYFFDEKTKEVFAIMAANVVLATGGIGQVYGHTTNPIVATGDGIGMANRAGVTIQEMEFVQFHPTALYSEALKTTFLISEAVRGFGAYLRTKDSERFMHKYDERLELASRDVVSQAIDLELKKSGEPCVYMDCTHLEMEGFKQHFPMIYQQCMDLGIDVSKDWIPVAPSQHYMCGGISVDLNGQTSMNNLFACGETARTGLHGANRLASNSLLEALVYSHQIYVYLNNHQQTILSDQGVSSSVFGNVELPEEELIALRSKMQHTMMRYVGIVRDKEGLLKAKEELNVLKNKVEQLVASTKVSKQLFELRNMIDTGLLIIRDSLERKESVGAFVILK